MTAFAQLEKTAAAQGYAYQKGSTGLANPYVPQVATAKPQSAGNALGWGAAELGADIAAGSNALTGIPWFLGKSIYQGLKGNWGQAATNLGMGALSLIPGAASAAAAGKGAIAAGRVANAANQAGRAASALNKYKGAVGSAQAATGAALNSAKALPGVNKAVGAYNAVAQPVGKFVRGAGVTPGAGYAANAIPGLRVGAANAGGMLMKQAPLYAVTGMIPNAAPAVAPQAPAALNPYQSLSHMTAATIANGGPLQ